MKTRQLHGGGTGFLAPVCLAVLVALLAIPLARAEAPIDFNREIRPILADNCFACHGPDQRQRKAKLRMDTREGLLAELKDGSPLLAPGKPAESGLVQRITHKNPGKLMPPPASGKRLSEHQIALLGKWIEQGARWSGHWAFTPPSRPSLPRVAEPGWPRNEIDYFILARLQVAGLTHSPQAERTTLLRRVTLELTGLPPTPAEIEQFLTDTSPSAYEKVVDRLLDSPRYGEHMARYWLDAARYGDTHGLHLDNYREMWPYREWVIRAFNSNLPYDQFLVEQLAGDLLPGATLDQQVATGFNRCHVTTSEGGSIEEEVYVRNTLDRVDTTGTVILGLTIGCARCHDHKFDPISAREYYQFFAYFNNIEGSPLDGNDARHAPIVRLGTPRQRANLDRAVKRADELRKQIAAEVARAAVEEKAEPGVSWWRRGGGEQSLPTWLQAQQSKGGSGLPRPIQTLVKLDPVKRTDAQKKQLRDYYVENVHAPLRSVFEPLQRELADVEGQRTELEKILPTTLVFKERKELKPAYILKRGEYDQRGEPVERKTPAFLPPMTDVKQDRLSLARWLVAPNQPLTARVAVNRFWQQCFGTGLVKTTEDFGSQGEPPSHPELLDWLAVEFQQTGWDVKWLMKTIVMSATYQQSSRVTPDRLARDSENRLLSRGPRFRLDAEMLRDQALALSGLLVERVGGASVKPPQPGGLWEAVAYTGSNTAKFTPDTGIEKVHRRSLYTFWKRTSPPPQMNAFDAPSREGCTVRRERTNTPLQALLLLNEKQYVECARNLAERTLTEGGDTQEERITYLFRLATSRRPDMVEMQELVRTLADLRATFSRDVAGAQQLIAVGESKVKSRRDPSELAAWTLLANLILNLDEVITKG